MRPFRVESNFKWWYRVDFSCSARYLSESQGGGRRTFGQNMEFSGKRFRRFHVLKNIVQGMLIALVSISGTVPSQKKLMTPFGVPNNNEARVGNIKSISRDEDMGLRVLS